MNRIDSNVQAVWRRLAMLLVVALPMGFTATGVSQEYTLTRQTVDGGGVMNSSNGAITLSGTIGQPDAGVMIGGGYQLSGGFWFPIVAGDCEEDGDLDLSDYAPFTDCITGPEQGPPDPACLCYDVNRNGAVEMTDFAAIQVNHTGS